MKDFLLDKLIKIVPHPMRMTELVQHKENGTYHKFKGFERNYSRTLCGEFYLTNKETDHVSGDYEEIKNYNICPQCLDLWFKRELEHFENSIEMDNINLQFYEPNKKFVKMLIENEGYDKFEEIMNQLIYDYLKENGLTKKMEQAEKENIH